VGQRQRFGKCRPLPNDSVDFSPVVTSGHLGRSCNRDRNWLASNPTECHVTHYGVNRTHTGMCAMTECGRSRLDPLRHRDRSSPMKTDGGTVIFVKKTRRISVFHGYDWRWTSRSRAEGSALPFRRPTNDPLVKENQRPAYSAPIPITLSTSSSHQSFTPRLP
jgi:hypothetical protein